MRGGLWFSRTEEEEEEGEEAEAEGEEEVVVEEEAKRPRRGQRLWRRGLDGSPGSPRRVRTLQERGRGVVKPGKKMEGLHWKTLTTTELPVTRARSN